MGHLRIIKYTDSDQHQNHSKDNQQVRKAIASLVFLNVLAKRGPIVDWKKQDADYKRKQEDRKRVGLVYIWKQRIKENQADDENQAHQDNTNTRSQGRMLRLLIRTYCSNNRNDAGCEDNDIRQNKGQTKNIKRLHDRFLPFQLLF
jgi:hypothetical protein